MRTKAMKRTLAFFIAISILLLAMIPSAVIINAAPAELTITIVQDTDTGHYKLTYSATVQPARTDFTWHDATGALISTSEAGNYQAGKMIFEFDFEPDHIYDITVQSFAGMGDTVPYAQGKQYFLSDITFTGECFNVLAKMSDIEDLMPVLEEDDDENVVAVESGNDPKIRFRWKVPTIYYDDSDPATNNIFNITDRTVTGFLNNISDADARVTQVSFQISMNKGKSSPLILSYNTVYDGNDMKIAGQNVTVAGITKGDVTTSDGFVTLTLDKNAGIEPGTEYEYTNIGLILQNSANEQVPVRRSNLRTDYENRFMVENIDNAFSDSGSTLSSIFTPIQMEMTKVDVDKVQVKFRRITNGVYPELYYQVQYATRIDDLYTQSSKWVKIPSTVIPDSELYGSEIVQINMPGTTHPELYFRVVYYDSSTTIPKGSSLCIDLRLLSTHSGKPPLPRNIVTEPLYAGRTTVTVPETDIGDGDVEIPMSDIRLSFEKPLDWKLVSNWNTFKNLPYAADDYTFHILLSSYLPGSNVSNETASIGLTTQQGIFMPIKQKRVLVIGKKDLIQDPNDANRLYCVIPGDVLFKDYTTGSAITMENNEDPSQDGTVGDYPTFLVPNITYYMQIFTSRYGDNAAINTDVWGDSAGLNQALSEKLSYLSPVSSFTTWPLNELPVPMPNLQLAPATQTDPVTGNITLTGLTASYNRILTEAEWLRYTNITTGREVRYEIFLSTDAENESSFRKVVTDAAPYPGQSEVISRTVSITNSGITLPNGTLEPIKPNTVYYLKARALLVVNNFVIGQSIDTPVKAITTPKIDSGSLDNVTREPRSPSEFNIALDAEGEPRLSDAWVELSWFHAEPDVVYDMVVTTERIDSQALEAAYDDDSNNRAFLNAYSEFKYKPTANEMNINVNDTRLTGLGFTRDANGKIVLPIRRALLRPNQTYFFSLRAVRNRGRIVNGNPVQEVHSRWITIPVTTKMVKAPAYLEAVRDLEVGFNVFCSTAGTTADSMDVYVKKSEAPDSSFIKLNRSQLGVVKDGNTYYYRIYNLEANQWYDFRLNNKVSNTWYDRSTGSWLASPSSNPVKAKTRDTLHEIEVRWEGEPPYEYFLEAKSEKDANYEKLIYHGTGFTDYGYDLTNGSRITYYREKTQVHVEEGSGKYIYYAKISGKPVRDSDGSVSDKPLKTNLLYDIKVWGFNLDDSLHVGPVSVRTDFSQQDYDNEQKQDNVVDVYNLEAEKLIRKLYWQVEKRNGNTLRVLLKGDMVSGLLKNFQNTTVTIDLSKELENALSYDILVPQSVMDTLESSDCKLDLKLQGADFVLNRGSIDLKTMKKQALVNGGKEAMLLLHIERSSSVKTALPAGFSLISKDYVLSASSVGSKLTYPELNTTIYKILKDPTAKGPFKYGLFDRELSNVLKNVESYSYRTHTELKDIINNLMMAIETELGRYIKDMLDGGSGVSAAVVVNKALTSFPGKIGVILENSYRAGFVAPFCKYAGETTWKEPAGGKGYLTDSVLFGVDRPGEYAVVANGSVTVLPGSPFVNAINALSGKYDLSKVFGKGTIQPANPLTGQQATMLYAVVIERDDELMGLSPAQKVSKLGVADILSAKQLTGNLDNQSAVSLAVRLYCEKTGIPPEKIKPSKPVQIANSSAISTRLYPYVITGVDLKLVQLQNKRFDATGKTTIGQVLDMIKNVLDKVE